jgi:hypothetical protein
MVLATCLVVAVGGVIYITDQQRVEKEVRRRSNTGRNKKRRARVGHTVRESSKWRQPCLVGWTFAICDACDADASFLALHAFIVLACVFSSSFLACQRMHRAVIVDKQRIAQVEARRKQQRQEAEAATAAAAGVPSPSTSRSSSS